MPKDNNVFIKLEIYREKDTGKLRIISHFDSNAPNIFNDDEGIVWAPTEEEKDLINDAFELMPDTKGSPSLQKIEIQSSPRPETDNKSTPTPQTAPEPQKMDQQPPPEQINQQKQENDIKQPEIAPKVEIRHPNQENTNNPQQKDYGKNNERDSINQDKQAKSEDFKDMSSSNNSFDNKKETVFEVTDDINDLDIESEKKEEKKNVDEAMIVNADEKAVEEAVKRRSKDKTMVEADEETIINKVLSQKKKWGRKKDKDDN